MSLPNDRKKIEMEVWLRAWNSVASAENCMDKKSATSWADSCLADFRDVFYNELLQINEEQEELNYKERYLELQQAYEDLIESQASSLKL